MATEHTTRPPRDQRGTRDPHVDSGTHVRPDPYVPPEAADSARGTPGRTPGGRSKGTTAALIIGAIVVLLLVVFFFLGTGDQMEQTPAGQPAPQTGTTAPADGTAPGAAPGTAPAGQEGTAPGAPAGDPATTPGAADPATPGATETAPAD